MKINIIKEKGIYTLEIHSGHFKGILEDIPQREIDSLIEALTLTKNTEGDIRVWNPRMQRHQVIKK